MVYYLRNCSPKDWKYLKKNLRYLSELALLLINLPQREYLHTTKDAKTKKQLWEKMYEQDRISSERLSEIRQMFENSRMGGKYIQIIGCENEFTYKYYRRKGIIAIFIRKDGLEERLKFNEQLSSEYEIKFAESFLRRIYSEIMK